MSGNLFAGGLSESITPEFPLAFCMFLLLIGSLISIFYKKGNKKVEDLKPIEIGEK
ncbi:hypothetical protein [Caldalkalibacillus salinus]|uniref:hypothetical protein n=1 Tax=Caldalkalibacillus salinus TaxID=2803787 RepID=UPI0019204E2C|nr:hypothetical protein [Caldalkalibacillus salinus]